jgi:hypothetical protein
MRSASAGIAERRIKPKLRFAAPMMFKKNHEDVMKASTKGRFGGNFAKNGGISLWKRCDSSSRTRSGIHERGNSSLEGRVHGC